MKRIRYKNEYGTLVSEPMLAGKDEIILLVYPKTLSYHIRVNGQVHSIASAKSVQMLKRKAREEVMSLGVNFRAEVRPRIK